MQPITNIREGTAYQHIYLIDNYGNNYLYTLGADHQDPQLSAPVGIVIGAAVVISLLRDCHLEGEFRRGEGPVGRRSRVGAHHFLEETHIVGRECLIVKCWTVGEGE